LAVGESRTGDQLFIVDNSDSQWKVRNYLREWTEVAHALDIATGYFEIGALLALDGRWQQLDKIRILMGDQATKRTRDTILAGKARIEAELDASIEAEKTTNDFLTGVPAIVGALRTGQIACRVYTKDKFHAKAYITHARSAVVGSFALVGSSNFTAPGLTTNVELNVQVRSEVESLQTWYEHYWGLAEDVTPGVAAVVERQVRDYGPFDVYTKALSEFFRGHEQTVGEWERSQSHIYPHLDQYQRDGYQALLKIADQYGGAFLCDGVGLGKTYIGLMVIERLLRDRKKVALFVPKAARVPVWERRLRQLLPDLAGDFSDLVVFNHTDLNREGDFPRRLGRVRDVADAIVIDEAHHFRNPGIKGEGERRPSRYRQMYEIADGKQLFLLTATPVNNRLIDLQHMVELFSRRERSDYFRGAPLGISSLAGHFRTMENALDAILLPTGGTSDDGVETNEIEAGGVLASDALFQALVVQRSRAYVKSSQAISGETAAIFPTREDPHVVPYSLAKMYGPLLQSVERAFAKSEPLFALAIYYPLAYYTGDDKTIDPLLQGRQRQVVALIRTQFLKRFESSARAFELSCETLLLKLLAFTEVHSVTEAERRRLDRWQAQHDTVLKRVRERQEQSGATYADADEDVVSLEMLEGVEQLDRTNYRVADILAETFLDMDQLVQFLDELEGLSQKDDDKLQRLIGLLRDDPVLASQKVLIFSEFAATAKYLQEALPEAGIEGVDEVDSSSKRDRGDVIEEFAPYYNDSSSAAVADRHRRETRILISTDVLSEGLNLQDATRLINYDLHWNPVRLMQRIGRVDRRLDPHIEERIVTDHPDQAAIRGTVAYWNFLPPDELNRLLGLYALVTKKTLRISKTFGIEGRKLLTPDDEFDALREFNQGYEGVTTPVETLHLEFQTLLRDNPGLEERINRLPGRLFSGKETLRADTRAVFFCYALPAPPAVARGEGESTVSAWTEEAGVSRWYLFDLEGREVATEPGDIADWIRSVHDTPRKVTLDRSSLVTAREHVERAIKNTYLKQVQAPIGIRAVLKAWMELS
jgi:superfamily II DNA or RNA helicase